MRSVFITGANGALGLGTVKALALMNVERVIMAARTEGKSADAKSKLLAEIETTSELLPVGGFDMHDPDAIAKAVAALPKDKIFDVVFFQAGGATFSDDFKFIDYRGTKVEQTVFQNAVGGYLTLTHLIEHGLLTSNARIVFIGGENARGVPGMNEQPVFDSAQSYRDLITGAGDLPKYNVMYLMGVSKLSSALLVQKLAQRGDGRDYIWFSPGLTHGTQGFAKGPALQRFMIEKVMTKITSLFGMSQSPDKGGQRCADALSGKVGNNGDIIGTPERKLLGDPSDQKPLNPSFTQQALIDEFWNLLQSLRPMPDE